jgi:hypothetical protein
MAKALGVPEKVLIGYAVTSDQVNKLNQSWITKIEINGHPLIEAFRFYLLSNPTIAAESTSDIKTLLTNFIINNLPYSLTAEFESNTDLLPMIMEQIKPITTNVTKQ